MPGFSADKIDMNKMADEVRGLSNAEYRAFFDKIKSAATFAPNTTQHPELHKFYNPTPIKEPSND